MNDKTDKTKKSEDDPRIDTLKQKYLDQLKKEYTAKVKKDIKQLKKQRYDTDSFTEQSVDYQRFKEELMPRPISIYEKLCKLFTLVEIQPDENTKQKLQDSIDISHLDITPVQAFSFAINFPLIMMLVLIFSSLAYSLLTGTGISLFIISFIIIISLLSMYLLYVIPNYFANTWRMKSTNQMILAIFYLVTYMRHTSNLERAIYFASRYITPPLALDLKKVLWDVEIGRYSTIKESVDSYLISWQRFNSEFVDAFHLIESSLYEPTDDRRIALLDKALDVILEGTFDNMLHFANGLKSPITILHMLGIIMPILGLVILPLVVSFLPEVRWYHIASIYNVLLPIVVFFFGKNILSNRPTGYGSVDITEVNPKLKKYQMLELNIGVTKLKISPLFMSILIFVAFFFLGISPLLIHAISPTTSLMIGNIDLLDYRCANNALSCPVEDMIGPFGLGAVVMSIFVTLSFALSIGYYNWYKTRRLITIRNELTKMDTEFSTALFQLGNRLGDGVPAEVAFGKVSSMMSETRSGKFFRKVSENITNLGMSVKQSLFDNKVGAIVSYPSPLVSSSMQVLVESVTKGPRIAANALASIARYVKEIHRVNERLKDLLSDVVSSMESQIKFLTPAIAGIVVGITSMMTFIIGTINKLFGQIGSGVAAEASQSAIGNLAGVIQGSGIPSYHFQVIIGVYVTQIIYILAYLLSNVRDGNDPIIQKNTIGNSLIKSLILYAVISLVVVILFNVLAAGIIQSVTGFSTV